MACMGWCLPMFSSTTKGISAFAILMQESHGHIDVDQKVGVVVLYWPEFAQNGKQDIITVA